MSSPEVLRQSDLTLLLKTIGVLGVILAVAGVLGVLAAGDSWAMETDVALQAAMTPVAVLAAAALFFYQITVSTGSDVRAGEGGAAAALALLTFGQVLLSVLFFAVGIAALSVREAGEPKTTLVAASFGLLGAVLGSLLATMFWMADIYRKPEKSGAGRASGASDSTTASKDAADAESIDETPSGENGDETPEVPL